MLDGVFRPLGEAILRNRAGLKADDAQLRPIELAPQTEMPVAPHSLSAGLRRSSAADTSSKTDARALDVDVRDFGARGDGTHDDTDAIQAAIHAAPAGTVLMPRGTYRVSRSIILSNFTSVIGSGPATVVVQYGTNQATFICGTPSALVDSVTIPHYAGRVDTISPYQPASIANMMLLGADLNLANNPYSGVSEQAGIVLGGGVYSMSVQNICWLFRIEGVHFRGFKRAVVFGTRIQGPTVIRNCAFLLNHIAIENMCYYDGGPAVIEESEFFANAHDVKSLREPAFGSRNESTYTPTWRTGDYTFRSNYFAGTSNAAPGVFNNYTYPGNHSTIRPNETPNYIIFATTFRTPYSNHHQSRTAHVYPDK